MFSTGHVVTLARSNTCYIVPRMSNEYHVSTECIRTFQNCVWAGKGVGCLSQQDTRATLCYFDGTVLLGGFHDWLLRNAACVRTKATDGQEIWHDLVPVSQCHTQSWLSLSQESAELLTSYCCPLWITFLTEGCWLQLWSKGHNFWFLHSYWWHQ